MNPVCQDQISTRPAETDFTLRLLKEIEFHPGKLGQFSTWFLLKFEFFFFNFSLKGYQFRKTHRFRSRHQRRFLYKKLIFAIFTESTCFGVILLKRDCNTGFLVNVVKVLRTTILKNIYERLLLSIPKSSAVSIPFL